MIDYSIKMLILMILRILILGMKNIKWNEVMLRVVIYYYVRLYLMNYEILNIKF